MSRKKLAAAVALVFGTAMLAAAFPVLAKAKSPHDFSGSLSGEFSTNEDVNVARASTDQWDFASFEDFEDAAEEDVESDEESEESDEASDDDFGDDFDDIGFDDSDLSEDDFELAVDDDNGDGNDDDVDNDGIDNALDDDDGESDDQESGDDSGVDLDPVIGEVTNQASRRKTKANRSSAALGLAYKYKFDGGKVVWGSNLRLSTDNNNNQSEKNKDNYAFTTGPEFKIKSMRLKIKPAVSWLSVHQENKGKVTSTWVGTLAVGYEFSKALDFTAVYNYQDRDITDPKSPDAVIDTLAFGVEWTATKNDIFKLRYAPKVEDSSQFTKDKDADGWAISYSRKLPYKMILGVGAKDDDTDYEKLVPQRDDNVRAYAIELAKQWTENFETSVSFETRELDSNIDKNDSKNKSFVISGSWKF